MTREFKVGDKVFHFGDPSLVMTIARFEKGLALCRWGGHDEANFYLGDLKFADLDVDAKTKSPMTKRNRLFESSEFQSFVKDLQAITINNSVEEIDSLIFELKEYQDSLYELFKAAKSKKDVIRTKEELLQQSNNINKTIDSLIRHVK